jgi:hypothetical protein
MKIPAKRYQDCSLPVRIWRRRHYLWIPLDAFDFYINNQDGFFDCFKECWSVATGLAQFKMNWMYEWSPDDFKKDFGKTDQ